MNDKDDLLQDKNPGFRAALFINLTELDSHDYTKDNMDLRESSRLSIESITPGTTSKEGSINKNETDFKFCLGRDLMQRLEELSPVKQKNKEFGVSLDMNNHNCQKEGANSSKSYEGIRKKLLKLNYGTDNEITPTSTELATPECDPINSPIKNIIGEDIYCNDETIKKINSFLFENYSFQMSNINSFNRNSNCYLEMVNEIPFNKLNIEHTRFNSNSNQNLKKNIAHEIPITAQNVVISGRRGWLCNICRNFNYQNRKQCNRCAADKIESPCEDKLMERMEDKKQIRKDFGKFSSENCKTNFSYYIDNINGKKYSFTNNKKKKSFEERDGDWYCQKCRNLNFSFRKSCNRCHESRKDSQCIS